jgi:hypothetical protein
MNFYVLATKAITRWAHGEGKFYPISAAPPGAYPITEPEYMRFNYYIAQGIGLQWYANQRPYVTKPWTQPIFTNSYQAPDGSVVSASSEATLVGDYAYGAMDGNIGQAADGYFWTPHNSSTGWWRVDFPHTIALTKLTHHNRYNATYASISGRYYTDATKTTPIGDAFSLDGSWTTITTYDDSDHPILTRAIYFEKTDGNGYSGIGELVLEATSMTYEAGEGR